MNALSAFDEKKYARLLTKALPVKIQTEAEYDRINAIVQDLADREEADISLEEERLLDLLSDLIQQYDEEHYPVADLSPYELLRSLMEDNGIRHKDLWPLLGSPGVASEVINGKRAISKAQAKKLGEFFKLDPGAFI